ncbi:hypothetical protein LTR24_002488 [Lithohypha guttulata]|uniref:Uncharacterized protein n=1 Tax=Lithohypha guttulata TaxID=1690604 RepID=A0ABR0KHY9_9EURO|nr:hypothetical protein LTR24_002488 [Lithohypha guttulata]
MHLLSWLINVQTKSSNVNIAVTPEQKSAENGLCRKHRESWNKTASESDEMTLPPSHRPQKIGYEKPKEDCSDTATCGNLLDGLAKCTSMGAALKYNSMGHEEECGAAK